MKGRIFNRKPIACDLETCMFRGQYLTCYYDAGKVSYRRCDDYQIKKVKSNEPKTQRIRGLEGGMGI